MSDFLSSRLAEVGLKADDVKAKDLVVPKGQKYCISQEDPKERGVKWIKDVGAKVKPKSWEHLKQLIGISDKAATRMPRISLKPIHRLASPEILKKHEVPKIELTRSAVEIAKRYLYTESTLYLQYLPFLEVFFGKIIIWIPFFIDITVEHDATLIIGKDTKSLWARDIKIKTGGKMDIRSDMVHIHCRSMIGNLS